MVARLLWEQDAGGSNPFTRTKKPLESSDFRGFSLFTVGQYLTYILLKAQKEVNQKKINFSIDFLKNCAIIYPKKKGDALWVTQNSVNL